GLHGPAGRHRGRGNLSALARAGPGATMSEHHPHRHRHPPQPDEEDSPQTYHQRLEKAVRALLLEKGVFSGDDLRRKLELLDSQTPAIGSRVVARAWVDLAFKQRLLADGAAAVA